MVASASESSHGDRDVKGTKQSRGAARRAIAAAKDAKIQELAQLVSELVQRVKVIGDEDSIATRLVAVLPGLNSAMAGHGGHIANRDKRVRRNHASHEPCAVSSGTAAKEEHVVRELVQIFDLTLG